MGDDPLRLAGLEAEAIDASVSKRTKKVESEESKIRAATNAQREQRLAKNSAGPSAPAAPPPPPPEPAVKDRSKLLDKLGQYRERFPDLKSRNKITGKSPTEEIEDEIHFVEQQLGGSGTSMTGNVFIAAMAGVEHITAHHFNPLDLNLTGLTRVSRDNVAEVQPILDELMIKYGVNMYVSPEMRLASLVGVMMYTVHAVNSGDPTTVHAMEKMKEVTKPIKTDL